MPWILCPSGRSKGSKFRGTLYHFAQGRSMACRQTNCACICSRPPLQQSRHEPAVVAHGTGTSMTEILGFPKKVDSHKDAVLVPTGAGPGGQQLRPHNGAAAIQAASQPAAEVLAAAVQHLAQIQRRHSAAVTRVDVCSGRNSWVAPALPRLRHFRCSSAPALLLGLAEYLNRKAGRCCGLKPHQRSDVSCILSCRCRCRCRHAAVMPPRQQRLRSAVRCRMVSCHF